MNLGGAARSRLDQKMPAPVGAMPLFTTAVSVTHQLAGNVRSET